MQIVQNRDISRMSKLGITLSDDYDLAKSTLIHMLKDDLKDVSEVYTLSELIDFYEAVNIELDITPHPESIYVPKKEKPKEIKVKVKTNRTKVRIDLTYDVSYITPLLEHLYKFDKIRISEIKTGLAIKYTGNFQSNICNYNELRTIKGILYGNLYLNLVKTENQINQLKTGIDYKWFRSFVMFPRVSIYDVIDLLTYNNMKYLISLNEKVHKRRDSQMRKILTDYSG